MNKLTDRFNREHTYLRIALTDNCNFRCTYCMPCEKLALIPHEQLMNREEIYLLASKFVSMGIKKIRLTGGEPLVRKDAKSILEDLSTLPVELLITTNGLLVDQFITTFKSAGIHKINVSLDSLDSKTFFNLTKRDVFHKVYKNIHQLIENDIHVKLNVVLMKGINDHEIKDFISLTKDYPLSVRFIEYMPFTGNRWSKEKVITGPEILERIESSGISFNMITGKKSDTARNYRTKNSHGTFGIISTMSAPFCEGCNRLRLTADGKLKNCLFSSDETDLLKAIREGRDPEELIKNNLNLKFRSQGGQIPDNFTHINSSALVNRSMVHIGG